MAAGQSAFWATEDVAELDALEVRLRAHEADRGANHVRTLRTVLELDSVYARRGLGFSTVPHAALVLGCSEHRANALLDDARGLAELPGALEAVECGLLTVEQSRTVVALLAPLPLPARLAVWTRLQERLMTATGAAAALPPARLTELLRRWVIEDDAADAADRRRTAEDARSVDYRRRDDGLWDLFAYGFRAPDLHAIASRIADRSAPFGVDDERTADQRRFDALKDMLLGREQLTAHDSVDAGNTAGAGDGHCRPGCDCRAGAAAPCGAQLLVHVPIGAALGTTDEAAVLVGHGPIEPDLLQDLLLAAPGIRPVWVDPDGVPVAVGDRLLRPTRDDPVDVRAVLLRLLDLPPPTQWHPRHRLDHPAGEHPPDNPGSYRPPRRLRRLIDTRSPRCEWPGCGARAVRCDVEHDQAWPDGPSCACNLGSCCRRHHRVKQLGWLKLRLTGSAVTWTGPTGRSWLSAAQHAAPAAPVRALSPVPGPHPFDELSPRQLDHELWMLGLLPDDDWSTHQPPVDHEPDQPDLLGERILQGDIRWTLDLDDPYTWLERAPLP